MSKLFLAKDLQLPLEAVTQTFGILAVKGAGKTNTGVVMSEELMERGQKVVVADPTGVWWGLRSTFDGDKAGFPVVIFGGDKGDLPLHEEDGEMVATSIVNGKFSAILDFSNLRKGQQTRFMTAFAEALYFKQAKDRQPVHFMVDEADAFAPQRPMKGEERMLGALEDIVRRGRSRGIGCTMISQRPAVLNKNVLTQIEVLIVLRIIGPQDSDAIDDWLKLNVATDIRKGMLESLAGLQMGEAWIWSPSWLQMFKRVQIRRRATFDSSATPKVMASKPKIVTKAEIDLDALGAEIAKAREKAKETDPKHLKGEIHRLKTQVGQLTADALKLQAKPLEQTIPGDVIGTLQSCATHMGDVVACARSIHDASEKVWNLISQLHDSCTSMVKKYKLKPGKLGDFGKFTVPALKGGYKFPELPSNAELGKRDNFPGREKLEPVLDATKAAIAAETLAETEINLKKGERRILEILVQGHPIRRTRSALGTLAGFTPSGGTFLSYLSTLRTNHLMEEDRDGAFATELGMAFIGTDHQPAPTSSAEVQRMWTDKLKLGEANMLKALISVYPDSLTRDQLAERVEMEPSGGTFLSYLSTLRTNHLLEEDKRAGSLTASESLFI